MMFMELVGFNTGRKFYINLALVECIHPHEGGSQLECTGGISRFTKTPPHEIYNFILRNTPECP